ncbi:MAG TPA: hypothetical protein VJV05_01170 [Pyrinomonadaceae bacterium]|nr:hypothetical protein [Pyrinomonadaceae bacterium]
MENTIGGLHPVHYLPILTTLFSVYFLSDIGGRFLKRGGRHLMWWAIGVFTYGLGTFFEGWITLFGNSVFMNKAWYVAGAILGGYPLAQGSVYLHFSRRTANILTGISLPFIVVSGVLVFLSPVNEGLLESFRPSGASLEWQWVRLLTPVINTYSAIFLIGSAFYSAIRWAKVENGRNRAIGNAFITIGALLPGIGGGMAKAGIVEALYVGEFIGIILIYVGYRVCLIDRSVSQLA